MYTGLSVTARSSRSQLVVQLLEHVERGPVHLGDHPERDRRLQGRLPATAAVEQLAACDGELAAARGRPSARRRASSTDGPTRRSPPRPAFRPEWRARAARPTRSASGTPSAGASGAPLINAIPSLEPSSYGATSRAASASAAATSVPVEQHGSRSGERLEQVSERDRLARGAADGGGNDRQPAVVEAVGDEPAQAGAHPGAPAQKACQPEQHRPADDRRRQWRPDPGGPAEQDRALKRGLVLGLHGVPDQVTQAGVDAVGGSAAVEVREHRAAFGVHRREQLDPDVDRARARTRSGGSPPGRAVRVCRGSPPWPL